MQIKSIVAGAAIALIAGVGFASANELSVADTTGDKTTPFAMLDGIESSEMSVQEMEQVRGTWFIDLDRSGNMTGGDLVPGGANHPALGPVDQSADILLFTRPI